MRSEILRLVENNVDLETVYDYNVDPAAKTIYFHDDVTEETSSALMKQLKFVDQRLCEEDDDIITVHICSYGGSIDHMFAIYDTIQSLKHEVHTIGTGAVCSAASLIIACGTKRHATENSWVMVHKGRGFAAGDEQEIEAQAFLFKRQEQLYYNLMAKHTDLTAKEWRDLIKNKGEGWFDSNEMLKVGLIDEIIKPTRSRPTRVAPTVKKVAAKKKK